MTDVPAGMDLAFGGRDDMRRGFQGLSAQVQTVIEQQPLSGHVFVFRGRRGNIVQVLWCDRDGLCLLAKQLERGRFIWPQKTRGPNRRVLPQRSAEDASEFAPAYNIPALHYPAGCSVEVTTAASAN